MKKVIFEAIATLVGVVIGAGILGIPYVISRAGFFVGFLNILIIGLLVLFVNLFLGEVILRTKGKHQLTGYAEKYLGIKGKWLMAFAMVIGNYGALLAYLIGEGEALSAIFGGSAFWFSICFFVVVSTILFFGLKALEVSELWFGAAVLLIAGLIVSINSVHLDASNFLLGNNNFFLPFGVVLFAFMGLSGIPAMHEELVKNSKYLKRCIIIGSLIPLGVYLLFGLSVAAVTGVSTTKIATVGLGNFYGSFMVVFGNLFAVFAMVTSFIVLGFALREMYHYDLGMNDKKSFFLVISVPLVLFLFGFKDFISTISFAGSFSGGIMGILVVLMLWKAQRKSERKPEFKMRFVKPLGILIIFMFILGMLYELLSLLGFL